MFKIVASLTAGLIFIAVLLFAVTTCVDVANSAETEPTEQELIQFCQDSVYHYYLSRTGIQLDFIETNRQHEDLISGIADSTDERLAGPVGFKCIYGEVAGVVILADIEVTQ
jgi:hypothetical protein